MSTIISPEERESYKQGLALKSDQWVIRCYEMASEAFDERSLVVTAAYVDEGVTLKRFRPRAQGRAGQILKRTSHITVVVAPAVPGAKKTRRTR